MDFGEQIVKRGMDKLVEVEIPEYHTETGDVRCDGYRGIPHQRRDVSCKLRVFYLCERSETIACKIQNEPLNIFSDPSVL
jgi:hypothetical protein